jgi:hypothetical protein
MPTGPLISTLRGLTSGTLTLGAPTFGVLVISTHIPSWLFSLDHLHLSVRLFVCLDASCRLSLAAHPPPWPVLAAFPAVPMRGLCLALCDGPPNASTFHFCVSSAIATIVAGGRVRRPSPGWTLRSLPLTHSAVGGVTDAWANSTVYTWHTQACGPFPRNALVPRDASTILDDRLGSRRSALAPCPTVVHPLRVHLVSSQGTPPVFHGHGLLPFALLPSLYVIAPSVYSKKGYWCIRKLSQAEILLACDVPERCVPLFRHAGLCPPRPARLFLYFLELILPFFRGGLRFNEGGHGCIISNMGSTIGVPATPPVSLDQTGTSISAVTVSKTTAHGTIY